MSSTWHESFLTRQVELLSRPDARAALRALRAVWGIGPDQSRARQRAAARPTGEWVGIWKRATDAHGRAAFLRAPERTADWGVWADVQRLPEKGRGSRVLLLGESVARGFFFDPGYNLAQALRHQLDVSGERRVEVLDLACAGQRLPGLLTLAGQVPALEPDAVIVFAGNNWRNGAIPRLSHARRTARAGALLEGGIAALKGRCEEELRDDTRQALQRLAAAFAPSRTPVILVIPDFNLVDWRESDSPPGWLPGSSSVEWLGLREQAQEALARGAYDTCERLAEQMRQVDGSTCPAALYLLADCRRARGAPQGEIRGLLEGARDSLIWDPSPLLSPRALRIVQDTMRCEGPRLGMQLVDLPRVFDTYLEGGLPGRRLFLDYCHLTAEGLQVAAAAIAREVLPITGAAAVPATTLLAGTPSVPAAIEGMAHLAAAIHNAHWGQPECLVEHHCRRALALHPAIRPVMQDYVELTARRTPPWMAAALGRIGANDGVALMKYIVSMLAMQPQLVDRDLLSTMARVLGPEVECRLVSLWCGEYGGPGATTELHDPCFAVRSLSQREAFGLLRAPAEWPDLLRVYSRTSSFPFVQEQPRAIEVRGTTRLPRECTQAGEFDVLVNGTSVYRGIIHGHWTSWHLTVPAAHVRRGINELTIRWPQACWDGTGGLSRAVAAIEATATPELFPAFGEIHSLTVHNH